MDRSASHHSKRRSSQKSANRSALLRQPACISSSYRARPKPNTCSQEKSGTHTCGEHAAKARQESVSHHPGGLLGRKAKPSSIANTDYWEQVRQRAPYDRWPLPTDLLHGETSPYRHMQNDSSVRFPAPFGPKLLLRQISAPHRE